MPCACSARKRGADPAALRIAQQRARAGRARQADVDRHIGGAAREIGAVFDDAVGREGELRDDVGAEALRPGERQFLGERGGEHGGGDARVPFGIAGQPHLLHAAAGEKPSRMSAAPST